MAARDEFTTVAMLADSPAVKCTVETPSMEAPVFTAAGIDNRQFC
jgi:hypothetical protein